MVNNQLQMHLKQVQKQQFKKQQKKVISNEIDNKITKKLLQNTSGTVKLKELKLKQKYQKEDERQKLLMN